MYLMRVLARARFPRKDRGIPADPRAARVRSSGSDDAYTALTIVEPLYGCPILSAFSVQGGGWGETSAG